MSKHRDFIVCPSSKISSTTKPKWYLKSLDISKQRCTILRRIEWAIPWKFYNNFRLPGILSFLKTLLSCRVSRHNVPWKFRTVQVLGKIIPFFQIWSNSEHHYYNVCVKRIRATTEYRATEVHLVGWRKKNTYSKIRYKLQLVLTWPPWVISLCLLPFSQICVVGLGLGLLKMYEKSSY